MLNTGELGFVAAVLRFTKTMVQPRIQGLQKDMLVRDAVLSLESCSNGVCGTCGLFTGRWPACKLTSTLGLRREVHGARTDLGVVCVGVMFLKTGQWMGQSGKGGVRKISVGDEATDPFALT